MKKLLIFVMLALSGCAVKPQMYDLSTSRTFKPIVTKQNLPNIEITDFKYEPNIRISQNTISHLGCLPCQSDGSTPGLLFADSINKIVQVEVKSAFKEFVLPTSKSSCTLNATIHLAAWDVMDGDTIVDLTYVLSKSDQVKFIKRIRGHYDNGLFESFKFDRILAKASRKSVEELVVNDDFLNEVNSTCYENISLIRPPAVNR
jgi:hypothetical protein